MLRPAGGEGSAHLGGTGIADRHSRDREHRCIIADSGNRILVRGGVEGALVWPPRGESVRREMLARSESSDTDAPRGAGFIRPWPSQGEN